jgi:hypothetical protein
MRCMVCAAEMILIKAVSDDTMAVPGFEHHTFMCPACHDVESRLVFARHDRDIGTEHMPGHSTPLTAPASTVQADRIATPVRDERFTASVQDERIAVPNQDDRIAISDQDERIAVPGLFRRVLAKIRGR